MTNERCNHWNTTTGSIPLRPIQCAGEIGHGGPHYLGDTAWDEALGRRIDPADIEAAAAEEGRGDDAP